jgi:hypothetical protein
MFVTVLLVATKLVTVLFVALSVDVLILVVAKMVPAVNPVLKFNVPELVFVTNAFVVVKLVERIPPLTSKVCAGVVVPIPILPPVT